MGAKVTVIDILKRRIFHTKDFHPFLKIMYSGKERLHGNCSDSIPFYGDMPCAKYFDNCNDEYPRCI